MATRIRLKRVGGKKQPHYRLVVVDQRKPRDGKSIEELGSYDPRQDPPAAVINQERALYWLSVGAQPSETARAVLTRVGVVARFEESRKGPAADAAPAAQ